MTITAQTAIDIALAHREVETAEKLLAEIRVTMARHEEPDIRDAFGRRQCGLQLGIPTGSNGQRLFNVEWALCLPIIEAHIAKQRALIGLLSEKARGELE